jgi:hypothetical protein
MSNINNAFNLNRANLMNAFNGFKGFNLNNINSFIKKATDVITCDSNCQKQKTAEELKQKYLASQTNLHSASSQVDLAEKNYVTFTEGELAYNNKKERVLHQKAKIIVQKFENNFNNDANQITSKINTYNGITLNLKNVIELYSTYKKENEELSKKLKDNASDVLTNERKSYYESQGVDDLKFSYYYILLSVYVICVIVYSFHALLYTSHISWKYRLSFFIFLLVLPFVSPFALAFTINVIYKIYELLPKNVHSQI